MDRSTPSLLAALLLAALAAGCTTTVTKKVDKQRQIEIHTEAAIGYLAMGEHERAIDQALRGLALAPEDFRLRLYLARALQRRGGTQDVLRAEQVLRQLDGREDFRVPLGLAEVLERKGLAYDQTAAAIEKGERFTRHADPAARAAELRRESRAAWTESLAEYEKANALRPNDPEVMSGLVRATSLLGRQSESLAWADAMLATTATDRQFWTQQLARPNLSQSEEDRIRRSLAGLTNLQIAVLLKASSTAVSERQPERAVAYLTQLIEIDPELPEAHSRRAQLLIELTRYEEAIAGIDSYLRRAGLPFDHPDVRRAFELRRACELALR